MEGDRPVGIFTEKDLLRAVARGEDLNRPVEELGTYGKLLTVKDSDPVGRAAQLMHGNNVRHLVVVDDQGRAVGVISIRDIINERHILSILSSARVEEWTGGD